MGTYGYSVGFVSVRASYLAIHDSGLVQILRSPYENLERDRFPPETIAGHALPTITIQTLPLRLPLSLLDLVRARKGFRLLQLGRFRGLR